jgi:hypothetical protein
MLGTAMWVSSKNEAKLTLSLACRLNRRSPLAVDEVFTNPAVIATEVCDWKSTEHGQSSRGDANAVEPTTLKNIGSRILPSAPLNLSIAISAHSCAVLLTRLFHKTAKGPLHDPLF